MSTPSQGRCLHTCRHMKCMSWALRIVPLLVCKSHLDFKTRLLKSRPRSVLLHTTWKTAGLELAGRVSGTCQGAPGLTLGFSLRDLSEQVGVGGTEPWRPCF